MTNQLRPALVILLLLSVLTGLLYPLAITAAAQAILPHQANGSRIERNGTVVGSDLVGQYFAQPRYFWPRPSATGPEPYNAAASSGSNIGPTSKALIVRAASSVEALGIGAAPADAVTTSASGLDPHITPQYATTQLERVSSARGVEQATVQAILTEHTEQPLLGIFGEPRVNVLRLNLALDEAAPIGN
jgi:K+-transporting ATPase ATPase C chain